MVLSNGTNPGCVVQKLFKCFFWPTQLGHTYREQLFVTMIIHNYLLVKRVIKMKITKELCS